MHSGEWDFEWVSTKQFCHLGLWCWQNIKAETDILWPFGNAELKPRKKLVPVFRNYFRREKKGGRVRIESRTKNSPQLSGMEEGIRNK